MGKTLKSIPFWNNDFPIKEVFEASDINLFNITNLNQVRGTISLSEIMETGEYHARINKTDFITFKGA